MKQIARRITGWLLVLSMVTSMFGQSTPITYAASNNGKGETPGIEFSMVYQSGGSSINADKDNTNGDNEVSDSLQGKNKALLGRGYENHIKVNLVGNLNGNGRASGMYFELELPVFRIVNDKLTLIPSEEAAKLTDEDFKNDKSLIRVMAEFTSDTPLDWDYAQDKHYWGTKVRVKNTGNVVAGKQAVLPVNLWFEGNMPENSASIVKLGGGYATYRDYSGNIYDGYEKDATTVTDTAATFTMICSNLEWTTSIVGVAPKNVLWDRYNYVTYKITIKNTSKDTDSCYDSSNFQIKAPTDFETVDGWESGLHVENAAKFLYNNGSPTANNKWDNWENANELMVGVPGKGGIMIYDVTELESTESGQAAMEKWDMTNFTNITDDKGNELKTMPYYFKKDGGIYFEKNGKVYSGAGVNKHEDSSGYDHRTFYVSLPMSTDIPSDKLSRIPIKVYNTIAFGEGYTWTKVSQNVNWGFIAPVDDFQGKKFVTETEEVNGVEQEVEKDEKEVAINDTVDYYLGHFQNTGNIPVFNAMATDSIDKDFELNKISAIFNVDADKDEPKLADWFDEDNTVQFEFLTYDNLNGTGDSKSEYVTLGKMEPDADLTDSTHKAWSLQLGSLIDDYIQKVEATGKKCVYNYHFRLKFKKRIEAGESFDGRVAINGVVSKGKKYPNDLVTSYERWVGDPSKRSEEGEDGYKKDLKELDKSTASIQAIVADPKIDTKVVKKTDTGYEKKDPMEVPVNTKGYGIYYQLGNDSVSKIMPGQFDSGELAKYNDKAGKVKGFITDKVILSKRLVDKVAKISSIILHTSADTNPDITLKVSDLSKDADGNYYIDKSVWKDKGELINVTVDMKSFLDKIEITQDNEDVYILLEGIANLVSPKVKKDTSKDDDKKDDNKKDDQNIPEEEKYDCTIVKGTFTTKYKDEDLNVSDEDEATLIVRNINPVIKGISYGQDYIENGQHIESDENKASGAEEQDKINQIEVPKGIDNAGYKFFVSNATPSYSEEAKLSIDLSSSVGSKTKSNDVRGFLTKTITIKNFKDVADIKQIRFWNWDKDPSTDNADVTIPFDSMTVSQDGTITIELKDYTQIEYLKYMVIDLNNFLGGKDEDTPEMEIQIDGRTEWFNNLDAVMNFTPDDKTMQVEADTKSIVDLTNRLYIQEPYAEIHADVHYYDLDGTTKTDADNRDKTDKWLGIPYDRDFIYTIDIGNICKSKLDDFDVIIDLPVNDNKQGDEANTGFHTTGIRISKELVGQYEKLEKLTLYDADSDQGKVFNIDYKNGKLISEDGQSVIEGVVVDGDIYIDEQKIYTEFGMNIKNLKKVIITGKGFRATREAPADEKHRVTLYGYLDSKINSWNEMEVNGKNYLSEFRDSGDDYIFTTRDTAKALVSKMYFDTTMVAGYKDNNDNGKRFDSVSDSYEHMRLEHSHYGWTDEYPDNDELDIGYKAIGSYLLDFRQYLNSGSNYPNDANHQELYDMVPNTSTAKCTPNDYVYTQSMNTAVDVEMTVNLPSNSFEAYYLKVHPYAYDYIKEIKIHREGDDNDTWTTVKESDWKDSIEKITGTNGKDSYYRLNLCKLGDEYGIYRSPKIDYKTDKAVDKIVIALKINRDASEEKNGETVAKNADYGTWYNFNDEKTKYMFEITGRFFKSGVADATASTKMDIGGYTERQFSQAKKRTDEGKPNGMNNTSIASSDLAGGNGIVNRIDAANAAYRSLWSWQDYYKTCMSYGVHNYAAYKSGHLFTTAKVYVHPEKNSIVKGVHETPKTKTDRKAKFSLYNEYSVSFVQTPYGASQDCMDEHRSTGHSDDYSIYNDPYNWTGKHSFTDKVVLTDTLPYVRPDSDSNYYGFLAKKILISEDLQQYIDKVVVYKKKSTLDTDGNVTDTNLTDTITIQGKDIEKENTTNNNRRVDGSDQHKVHTTASRTFYEIPVVYPQSSSSSQVTGNTAGSIVLGDDEYITKYEIHLKDLGGDVDYAAELKDMEDLLDSHNHGVDTLPDIYVGGDIYRITDDNIKTSGKFNDWNNMKCDNYMQESTKPYTSNNDSALITSYRIPFQAGVNISVGNKSNTIYDYQSDNKTPNLAKFNIKVWNRQDTNSESGRSAEIDSATVTNSMDSTYRLKHIYIPEAFITGDWFNVDYLKIGDTTYTLAQLKTLLTDTEHKYFSYDSENKQYVFDVNEYVRDRVNTLTKITPNNTKKDSSQYYKEFVDSFVIKFKGVGEGILDGGDFLNVNKENLADVTLANAQSTFSYDGVYVDRNKDDIEANAWTYDSTPTIINSPDSFTTSWPHARNYVSSTFTTQEPDAWGWSGYVTGTSTYTEYVVKNLVSTFEVSMKRETKISDSTNSFAYDIDGKTKVALNKNQLLPDDFIEYQISLGTSDDSAIPVYHPDVRFIVPNGQRIIGWYILENDSDIGNEDITAQATSGSNTVSIVKDKRYYKASDNTDTNYKQLNISCGDLTKDEKYNQITKGKNIKIVVITELTQEVKPFEGKNIVQNVYVTTHPKHTYSQHALYYKDSGDNVTYGRLYGQSGYYGSFYNNESSYVGTIKSDITYYNSSLTPELVYVDGYETPGRNEDTNPHIDERPMIAKLYGPNKGAVTNSTTHKLSSITYTTSFLTNSRKDGRWFKGFDLTEKPEFAYPENMDSTGTKKAKVEYCFYKDLSGKTIGTDVGIYTDKQYISQWVEADKVLTGDTITQAQIDAGYFLLKDAVSIRWTYYDVPAEEITFATADKPFELHGIGRYRDTRNAAEKQNTTASDKFTIGVSASCAFEHLHDEDISNTDENQTTTDTKYENTSTATIYGSTTAVITRERPILTVHTQIFKNSDDAAVKYNANAEQIKGYRPGDKVWYKTTVINNKRGQTDPQGALLNPALFDKIPEYITTSGLDANKIKIKWYNADGTLKDDSEIPKYTITKTKFSDAADYGGDFVTTKNYNDGVSNTGSGHAYTDLIFNGTKKNTDTTSIDFNVYQIQFDDGSRLEIGETLEVYYEAEIRKEDLPLAYTTRNNEDGTQKTYVDYYPKMGEYYQWQNFYWSYSYSYPYIGTIGSLSTRFANQNDMMDMNYLYHDVGVSGTRNKNIDKYEYLKESITYMPGSNETDTSNGNDEYGNNGYLKDQDMRTANNQQMTYYDPTRTTGKYNQLPVSENYRNGSVTGYSRDYYNKLMVLRVRDKNWQGNHEDVVIWTESRLHLQTAWLLASSQMIGDDDYLKSQEYLPTNYSKGQWDDHYTAYKWYYSSDHNQLNDYIRNLNDDTITTLEYDQDFTTRIGAYNYGDWDIESGLEFTYVMPQGIEPKLDKDGNPDFSDLKAEILSSGTSKNPVYSDIDIENDVKVEVIQSPNNKQGYLTPNIMRDPLLSTSTMNNSGDSYENKDAYYSEDEHTSWVLRITITKPLKKWFNRGDETGYAMYVNIPSHVYATPKNEYWYDEVMVKPVDTTKDLYYQVYDTTSLWGNNYLTDMPKPVSTQKYGMDFMWNTYYVHDDHHRDSNYYFLNGSPNTPYINGMNITNREVSSQGKDADSAASASVEDRKVFSSGVRNTYASTGTRAHMRKPMIRTWTTVGEDNINGSKSQDYYVDPQGETSTLNIHVENKYWLNTLAPEWLLNYTTYQTFKVRHTYATDGGNMGTLYHPVVTNILPAGIVPKDTDGNLFTTDNKENAKKKLDWTLRGADYNGADLDTLKEYQEEQELYEATVEYIQLEGEDGTLEGRYKITFKQKEKVSIRNEKKVKIDSESSRVFSFKFFTADNPDLNTKDGTKDERLGEQYQSNRTFISSEMNNFKFKIDSDVENKQVAESTGMENPYYVGNEVVDSYVYKYNKKDRYHWTGTLKDSRLDIAETNRDYNDMPSGTPKAVLPKVPTASNLGSDSAIDATDQLGNKRYYEKDNQIQEINGDQLSLEDYPELRQNVYLRSEDKGADLDNGCVDSNAGVMTSNRIRVKYPVIENKTFVSKNAADAVDNLGARSPEWQDDIYEYYPSEDEPVQYMDDLYYNVKVVNGADKVKDDEYYYQGNISHAKMKVTVVLPSIVKAVPLKGDAVYLIYKKADGTVVKMNIDEAEKHGYELKVVDKHYNDNKEQVITFEVCTAGDYEDTDELPIYSDYVHGKHLPGYFAYKDTLVVGVKTQVRNNVLDDSEIETSDEAWKNDSAWDNKFKADGYVTFDDADGYYLKDTNPDGGFDALTDLDDGGILYEREATDDKDNEVDYDSDGDYSDKYAKDESAIVTLLKPHSTVRLDTSVQRREVDNPDILGGSHRTIDDPIVKSSVRLSVYMDQAVNEGSAVREFIVDWRIPFRSTFLATKEEAPVNEDSISKQIYAIGTGVWEIPENCGDEAYREALKRNLKVQVLALCNDNVDDAADGATYQDVKNSNAGEWLNLTQLYNEKIAGTSDKGVSIDKNTIIDIRKLSEKLYGNRTSLGKRIYQVRYIISSDEDEYVVPKGFRLDIDADSDTDGKQEMNDVDPEHNNLDPLPESVVSTANDQDEYDDENKIGNAAFVMMTASHLSETRRHVNHFATGWAKYDDTQLCADSERSRAGYYIAKELPVMEIDMKNQYFMVSRNKDTNDIEFGWSNDITINNSSNMLKYSIELKNLDNEEIAKTDVGEVEEDYASNPQVVALLPVIQNLSSAVESEDPLVYKYFHEVEYGSDEWKNSLAPTFKSPETFDDSQAVWSWHVEDKDGNVVSKDKCKISSVSMNMYEKIAGIKYERQRRFIRWTADGQLEPGQRMVIDYMLPIATDENTMVESELLSSKGYGFKSGAFEPSIPVSQNVKNYAYEIDTRDVNDNGKSNIENTITVSVNNVGFAGTQAFNRNKRAFSEYGYGMSEKGTGADRPALVPEGTKYSFTSSIYNPEPVLGKKGYRQPIIYDVLPFVGDTQLYAPTGFSTSRGTDWRGWLNLESIKIEAVANGSSSTMTDGNNVNVWIGPFKYNGNTIEKTDISDLPTLEQTSSVNFYKSIRGKTTSAINEKKRYFVRLSDLLKLKTSDPEKFEELQKHAQAIYVEPTDDYYLSTKAKLSVSYDLKAPLNLPLSKNCISEESETILQDTADSDSWNSFTAQSGDDKVTESPNAGVCLTAPSDRGYIGHYVWLDESYNAKFTDEADYYQRDGKGRWLLEKKTKDLDYDGEIDDPGINGVKVELLTENGYPVNRLGEAVVEKDGKYCVIDESTGKIKTDTMGSSIYTTYGPMSYTTEKDVYGNDGYFIISNIKPGKYKLRYTFPKDSKYNQYALTTRSIGVTGTSVDVYRPGEANDTLPDLGVTGKGDEPSDSAKVESLTIQTKDAIQIDAIGTDESTYQDYDEKMTSYDLGVAPSFEYGGYSWMDIQYDAAGKTITDSIDGKMDDAEKRLKNVDIYIYEVKTDGTMVPAYDKNGNEISTKNKTTICTDSNGYFSTTLYPYRSYIAIADTGKIDDILKPSPVTLSTKALQYEKDNDLLYNKNLNKNTTNIFSVLPKSDDYDMGNCVDGRYGSYDRLGFGYVPAGVGAIGKYIFEDQNYDGIRNEYIDENGLLVSEPGIDGIKLVLEKYYYDNGKWIRINDDDDDVVESQGSSYTFIVDTSYKIGDNRYLCGYKVKLDMSSVDKVSDTLGKKYISTKFYMNNGLSDSDLPLTGGNYRYLTDDIVVPAGEATDSTLDDYKFTADGKDYDISDALIITEYDAGLTTKDDAEIDGVVWEDKNYNGKQDKYTDDDGNEVDEPGIENIELQLVPYVYYNNKWQKLKDADLKDAGKFSEYTTTTNTDADGAYKFTDVKSTATMADGTECIVGYKVRVNTNIDDLHYGITKYRNAAADEDSDLWKNSDDELMLNENDEFIITAKKIPDKDVKSEYGEASLNNQSEYLIHNNLGYFDVNKVTDHDGSDAGLVRFEKGSVSGKVWLDDNYDGIMDSNELGMVGQKVTIKRFYLDSVSSGTENWVEDTTYTSPVSVTDSNGEYNLDNLDTFVYKDGKYYLAGYKVYMAEDPDNTTYGPTLYGTYDPDTQRGSDLKNKELTKDDDYIIVADSCGNVSGQGTVNGSSAAKKVNELAHVTDYKDKYYDLVTSKDYEKLDAGYHAFEESTITGNVFEDYNYDGIINSSDDGKADEFTQKIKDALGNKQMVVTATTYYYDNGQWKQYLVSGNAVTYTDIVDATSIDGKYEIEVPTQVTINNKNYLAGYKLQVDIIPDEYHVTKHKANGVVKNSNALIKENGGKYDITKTLASSPYAGTDKEEMDGYVIAAKPSTEPASATIIGDYDIALGRDLTQYNMGLVAHDKDHSYIDGIAFEDNNNNGKYDTDETDVTKQDKLLSGVKIGVKRYKYDVATKKWVEAPNNNGDTYYATTVTDTDGYYAFKDLPSHEDTNDKPILYGYTVWLLEMPVNDEGQTLAATYYQANNDKDDSALIANSMQVIKGDKNPNLELGELMDGNTMIAKKITDIDPERSHIVEDYDCTISTPRKGYNLGFVKYAKGSIEGCVFDDKNVDGIIDKNDGKLENITIGLKRYVYENGQWKLSQGDDDYYTTTVTDADGNYKFNGLDTFVEDNGDKHIYGYEVWVVNKPAGYGITRYQSNNGTDDSAVLLNSQVIKKNTSLDEMFNGKLVVARKASSETLGGLDDLYVVEGYDVVRESHLKDYNAGYTELRKGIIEGIAFDDEDYDGELDSDEKLFEGVEIGLKRFIYENGKWKEDNEGQYVAKTTTDKDGHYVFDNLDTYVNENGENKLYGYEVWVTKDPSGYAKTKYGKDSFLLVNDHILKNDTDTPEIIDGKTVVAHKITDQDDMTGIDNTYNVNDYYVIMAEVASNYNAGYIKEEKGSISGTVFDDVNYDGKIDENDKFFEGFEVGLKQFVYEDGKWNPTNEGDFIAKATTDKNGNYTFDNLDTHKKDNGVNKLYGYEVWVIKNPDGYAVTRYGDDSYLLISGQIVKADTKLDEIFDGKTVVAHKVTDEDDVTGIDDVYFAEGYNVVKAEDVKNYNGGYVKEQKGSISGTVFDDVNYDGKIDKDDKYFEGFEVGLKQFVYEDGKWNPTNEGDFIAKATTDKNGNYTFDNLDTHKKDNGVNKLYGYEVWVIKNPDGYAVTRYGDDSYLLISGQIVKSDTKLDEILDGKTVVAYKVANDTEKSGIDDVYFAEGYNVVEAEHVNNYNAGYVKEQKGSISGTVFDDVNYDGKIDENDKFFEGFEVGLKQFVYEDGKWVPTHDDKFISTTKTNKNGEYTFDNLDTHKKDNGVNKLYGYEVWVIKDPDGYAVTRYGDDSYLLVSGHILKADTKLDEILDGKTVVAHKATTAEDKKGVDDIYMAEGYNVIKAEHDKNYNAGYVEEQRGSISGTIFEDVNYDGKIDEDDKFFEGFEVGLKQFVYEDGQWVPTHEEDFISTTTTDANGGYLFSNLNTHKKEEGTNKLYGYEVWVIKDPDGYAVTRYGDDSYLLTSGHIIKADTSIDEMLDGKTVIASKITEDTNVKGIDDLYKVEGYNVILAEHSKKHNGGYTEIKKAAISGSIFDDVNYDGLINDGDKMLENVEIGLKRFVYKDGQWMLAPENTTGQLGTGTTEDVEFFAKTKTDKDGNYKFDNLDTFVNEDGTNYMYGYKVYVIDKSDRQTTKYEMNNGDKDSSLRSDTFEITKKEDGREELFKGCIVLAQKADNDENPNTPYIIEGYDVVKGIDREQYNGGFVAKRVYSISGFVWVDKDRDGISNEKKYAKGVTVTLEKLYLNNGKWVKIDEEEPVTMKTGKDGKYKFDNLELYGNVDEKHVVYGYRVKVSEIPSQYGVTKFHVEAEGNKSDLNEKTGYLETEQALMILADKADNTTPADYNVDGYNISYGFSVESLDAGIIPYGVGSIAGIVFEDANADGIIDKGEQKFENKDVYLLYKKKSDDKFVKYPGGKTVTDKRGFFKFENLPVLDENNEPYEYRLTMEKPDERSFTKDYDFVIFGSKQVNILAPDTSKGAKDKVTTGITPTITLAIPRKAKSYYKLKYELDGYNHKNAYLGFTPVEKSDKIQTGLDMKYWWALVPMVLAMLAGAILLIFGKKRRKEVE